MERAINRFDGVVDKDTDITDIANNNLVDALNNFSGKGGSIGVRNPIPGNTKITFTLPAGVNDVIGCVEDTLNHSLIYFVRNSSNDHLLLRYDPINDVVQKILEGSTLEFGNTIHSARIVDGKFLYWCDGFNLSVLPFDQNMTGTEPKKINIDKANLNNKSLEYEVNYDQLSFQTLNQTYALRIEDLDGNIIVAETIFYTVNPVIGADAAFQAFGTALDGAGFPINVTICDNKIFVQSTFGERRIYLVQSTSDLHFYASNHYPETLNVDYLTMIKRMPKNAPKPRFVADSNIYENKLYGNTFQFRYRYIFDDGEKSAFSPISYVPTNLISFTIAGATPTNFNRNDRDYNKIIVDLNDAIFDIASWKTFIRKIELAVRVTEEGIWKSVGIYDVADIGIQSREIEFFNDGEMSVIPSDTNSSSGAQALKNFDFLPRKVESMDLVADREGNNRMVLGGLLEGFDLEACTDAVIQLNYYNGDAPTTTSDQESKSKSLKKGGVYNVGVVYEDDYGRQSSVIKLERIKVPFDGEDFGLNIGLEVEITSPPPIWATRYRIVISKNQNQSFYVQVPIDDVNYFSDTWLNVADGTAPNCKYVSFLVQTDVFQPDIDPSTAPPILFEKDENSLRVFQAQEGDRLQIMGHQNIPTLSLVDKKTLNYPILAYSLVSPDASTIFDAYNVIVENDTPIQQIDPNGGSDTYILIELYRQKEVEDQFYYEVTGEAIDIVNPGQPTRTHGGNQIIQNLGDTYWSDQEMIAAGDGNPISQQDKYVFEVERPNLHFGNEQLGPDWGRVNAEDPNFRELINYNKLRLSDIFIPDSAVNGLSSYRGLEFIKVDKDYGPIKRLEVLSRVMLVICKFACQPIYIGQDTVVDLSGRTTVGISDQVLNLGNELLIKYGTFHPESVINTGQYIYGFDVYKGVWWRYNTGNGLFPISDYGWYKHFKDRSKESFAGYERGSFDARAGFDPRRNIVFLYTNDQNRVEQTVGFNETKNGMEGFFSFFPDYFGRVGLDLLTFKDGELWKHGSTQLATPLYCNFYGTQEDCTVTFAFNANPAMVKIPRHIRIRADQPWSASLLEVLPNPSFAEGQKSRLLPNKFELREGQFCADILRDYLDTAAEFLAIVDVPTRESTALLRGRHLRGEVILVTLKLDDPSIFSNLESADIAYTLSFNSF